MTQGKDNNKPRIPDSVDHEPAEEDGDGCQNKEFADQRMAWVL